MALTKNSIHKWENLNSDKPKENLRVEEIQEEHKGNASPQVTSFATSSKDLGKSASRVTIADGTPANKKQKIKHAASKTNVNMSKRSRQDISSQQVNETTESLILSKKNNQEIEEMQETIDVLEDRVMKMTKA